jgi:Flp pilus assembly protein TadB
MSSLKKPNHPPPDLQTALEKMEQESAEIKLQQVIQDRAKDTIKVLNRDDKTKLKNKIQSDEILKEMMQKVVMFSFLFLCLVYSLSHLPHLTLVSLLEHIVYLICITGMICSR